MDAADHLSHLALQFCVQRLPTTGQHVNPVRVAHEENFAVAENHTPHECNVLEQQGSSVLAFPPLGGFHCIGVPIRQKSIGAEDLAPASLVGCDCLWQKVA